MSASYWVIASDKGGVPSTFMWNCELCEEMGVATSESVTVETMNDHVAAKHPNSDYVAPPIPE